MTGDPRTALQRTVRSTLAVTGAALALVAMSGIVPVQANPHHVDPASLPIGAEPRIVHLVGDTIRDGDRAVPATRSGEHLKLWRTAGGYLVDDYVQGREVFRLVFVSRTGDKRVIARRESPSAVAVSPGGRWVAWASSVADLTKPTIVQVADPRTGDVLATRQFRWATVFAVSPSRVLLTLRGKRTPETTWWWDYRQDTLSQVSTQPARRVDLWHDRIVFAAGPEDSFCNRLAPLSRPDQTLWESCRLAPHRWSPNGARALATHTYFDETGTDRWLTVRDRTGARLAQINGRLDWDAVWEDDRHFLTMAQSRDTAAVIRCTVGGRCQRAGGLWHVPWDGAYPPYYAPPPVLLPEN